MLDLDRRSFVLASTVGSAHLAAGQAAAGLSAEDLHRIIADVLNLDGPKTDMVAARLNWSGRWPSFVFRARTDVGLEGVGGPGVGGMTFAQNGLPSDALIALWEQSALRRAAWLPLADTQISICGVSMMVAQAGNAQACVLGKSRVYPAFTLAMT